MKVYLILRMCYQGVRASASEAFREMGWHYIGLRCMIPGHDHGCVFGSIGYSLTGTSEV